MGSVRKITVEHLYVKLVCNMNKRIVLQEIK